MADYIAAVLKGMGLTPHFSYFPEDEETKQRPSLWTELDSGRPGKTLMLIGHIDTVDVTDGWNTDPFTPTEVGDRVYGRGAMDMKGGLAAILETLEYYAAHTDEICGKILACFVSDEEGLSKGTYQLVKEGLAADYAIMANAAMTTWPSALEVGIASRSPSTVWPPTQATIRQWVKTPSSPAASWRRPSRLCLP